MRRGLCAAALLLLARASWAQDLPAPPVSTGPKDETIVFFRHGEKPAEGLGQLSCKGLHRALALTSSPALSARPDYLFAPDPGLDMKLDEGVQYPYIRALATIEPLAVKFGMPVNTSFGFRQFVFDLKLKKLIPPKTEPPLIKELLSDKYQGALIYICWEHHEIADIVDYLQAKTGTPAKPTRWADDDFDGLLRVTLRRKADGSLDSVSVARESEGLSPASDCRF